MERGVIKMWNARRGFGFIARDAGGDVFLHQSVLAAAGLRSVAPRDVVEFEVIMTPRGPRATTLRLSSAVADIQVEVDRDLIQTGRRNPEVTLPTAARNLEGSAIVDWCRE